MINYDFPLTERIRTFLRLEDLNRKICYFTDSNNAHDHHSALLFLFQLLDVTYRADIKLELITELSKQKQMLESFANNPDISHSVLQTALHEIEQALKALFAMQGKIGENLRANEWLMTIRKRIDIPGGSCEFDLPSYHHWLNQDTNLRRQHLNLWFSPFVPLLDSLSLLLKILRNSEHPRDLMATNGSYQVIGIDRQVQLLQLKLQLQYDVTPEISANRYAINIRFLGATTQQRPHQVSEDIPFQLSLCRL